MKKFAIILAAVLLSASVAARADTIKIVPGQPVPVQSGAAQTTRTNVVVTPYPVVIPYVTSLPPYSCSVAGFNLVKQQDVYYLIGPVYVPERGYSYSVSPLTYAPNAPAELGVTLTLVPPSNPVPNSRMGMIPPLGLNYSFVSSVPVHRITVDIANPITRLDTQIYCLQTGASR